MKRILPIAILFIFLCQLAHSQYLHREGKYIVDGEGQLFQIRSMGLGGWMLQEGYMLGTGGFAGTQHEIRALMEAAMGQERTDEFYDAWLANHCTKTDIDSLAAWGFNAVRPALHYNLFTLPIEDEPVPGQDTWLETGFRMVDELLEWCKAREMYVILDLHAAPGGQGKNADISDYDASKPSLWESEENKRKTVALWRKLAERYANEKYIGGYDLINETNWSFTGTHPNGCDSSNEPLRELMVRITQAIREVDQNHLIFIEGNCWANNMTGMFPPWDDNLAYSFHKYWNGTDKNTISEFLGWREQYNVPIWMGESGENANQWFYETIRMLELQQVGWSWWPMKKIGSVVGPLTAIRTPEYSQLLDIWRNGGTPDPEFCYQTLMQITENLMIENCTYQPDVIDAMFRQQTDDTGIPYKKHEIPGVIAAPDFDMGRHGVAYFDKDFINSTGNAGGAAWNQGHSYRNDGVDIEPCADESSFGNGYNVGWLESGEWMGYTVEVYETAAYRVTFRVAGTSAAGKFHLEVNGKNITGTVSAKATTGNQSWTDVSVDQVMLEKGRQTIRFVVEQGGFNLNYMQFADPEPTGSVPGKATNGYASPTGTAIYLAVNKNFDQSVEPDAQDFRLKVNGFLEDLDELTYDTDDSGKLVLGLKKN
ncbi:MAG: cellulase family glycosylhydrolase [Mangrovibacterium sp.]